MSKDEFKKVPIEQIPEGTQFKAALRIPRTKAEIKEANDWWAHLSDDAKCLIYWGFIEAMGESECALRKCEMRCR